jgi:hypothetical protein
VTPPVPAVRVALLAFAVSFGVLIANGRAIGSGDTNVVENTAAALATRGTFVLPATAAADPFTRELGEGRISIYPALPALLAVPVFFVVGLFFDLTPQAIQVAGKLTGALLSSLAVAVLTWNFAKRASPSLALVSALLFGLGTSVFSTSQALWQHPATVLFLCIALSALQTLEASPAESRSGVLVSIAAMGLALASASRPAAIPMCGVLLLFLVARARPHARRISLTVLIPAALVAIYNTTFFGAPWRFGPDLGGRFGAAFPESVAGLLISPARGLLVFTPIALVALWSLVTLARGSAFPRALLAGAATHFAFISMWNEWHGGESFGPRLLTDLLPVLFFFLPDGLAAWPKLAAVLGTVSVAVQLLGGFTYDYRWERLHQRGGDFNAALWSWRDSPLAFAASEGVVVQGVPEIEGRRLRLPTTRSVPFGTRGSTVEGTPQGLRISGEPLMRDIRLERGARLTASWITLFHPADAVVFRSNTSGDHTLRLVGTLKGLLRLELPSGPIATAMNGDFDLELPIRLEKDADVAIRAEAGELRLARMSLSVGRP